MTYLVHTCVRRTFQPTTDVKHVDTCAGPFSSGKLQSVRSTTAMRMMMCIVDIGGLDAPSSVEYITKAQ